MADEIKQFFRRIQLKPAIVAGHVANVTVDPATGQQLSALVTVGNNTIRVRLDPNTAPLANGDQVRLEQYGYSATAEYKLAGIEAGGRPNSGTFPVLNDGTILGGATYAGGDLIIGKLDEGNLFAEYATGRLYHRIGASVYGIDYPDGARLFGHAVKSTDWAADGPNVYIDANGIRLRNALTDALTLDSTNGIRMYSGASQRVWIKPDGSGWLGGAAKLAWDTSGNVTLAGAITATSGSIAGWSLDAGKIYKTNAYLSSSGYLSFGATPPTAYGNNVGVWLGYASGAKLSLYADASNYFQWDGAKLLVKAANFTLDAAGNLTANSATITGAITATSGAITGSLYVGSAAPRILIDGANKRLESTNFASGTAGFRLDGSTGDAEFANITARGAIKTAVFQKSLVLAFAGSQMVSKSASTLATDCTLSATTFPLVVRLQAGAPPFATGDLIYIKTETAATYATVNTGAAAGGNWSYTATYKSGTSSGTVKAGETVVDFGPNGTGRLLLTADQSYAPFLSIATHDMAATPVWTERVRLGNLDGISGASGYGLWTDNGFFTGTVDANAGHIGTLDVDGILTLATGGELRQGTVTSGSLTGAWPLTGFTGLRIWNESGVGRIAGYAAAATEPQWYAGTDGKLYAGGGKARLDANGVSLNQSGSLQPGSTIKWYSDDFIGYTVDPAYNLGGAIYGYNGGDGGSQLYLKANAQKYYQPGYGWQASGAAVTLWARDEVAASPVSASLYVGTNSADGTHSILMTPATGKGIRADGFLTLNDALKVVRNSTTYTGKVLIAKGTTYNAVADTLTTSYGDIISVTQTVPAGTLVMNGTIQWQVQSANGLCECDVQLVVDGTVHMTAQAVANHQWFIGVIPLNWCGDVPAGSRTWKLQAKYKDGTHTVIAMTSCYMAWHYYA